jgi:hypothetical protein
VTARVADAPNAYAARVDIDARTHVRDAVDDVVDLLPRIDVLPRLTFALAEIAVVECEHGDASIDEECTYSGWISSFT